MKYGLISLFAMYLVIRFVFNIIIMSMYAAKKVSAGVLANLAMVENVVSLIFSIMIIRLAVKSGGRA
jgi:hypothetical protein